MRQRFLQEIHHLNLDVQYCKDEMFAMVAYLCSVCWEEGKVAWQRIPKSGLEGGRGQTLQLSHYKEMSL